MIAALGRVASSRTKQGRDSTSELADVLRQSRSIACGLLNDVGTRFLLFLVSQRWKSTRIDAISRSLEVRRPSFPLHFRGLSRFDCIWKR